AIARMQCAAGAMLVSAGLASPQGMASRSPPPAPPVPSTTLFRSNGSCGATRRITRARWRSSCPLWGDGEDEGAREAGDRLLERRSEEHTSELQSRENLVCRPLLEKKNCRPGHCERVSRAGPPRTS